MQCLTTTKLPLNLGGTQAAGPCLSLGRAASSTPAQHQGGGSVTASRPGKGRCPHTCRELGLRERQWTVAPQGKGHSPPTCPQPPGPLRKAPAPASTGEGAGAHHHGGSRRDSGETGGARSSGEGAQRGRVCVCPCVLHTHPRAWCACQVCACPPRVPTQRVHVSVGARPCSRPAAQLAVHSWTRGPCARPDARWQVCNKALVTVTFPSSGLPGRGCLRAGAAWRVSSCELRVPYPPGRRQGCRLTGEQLAGVGLVLLPCPRGPRAGGQGLVCAQRGREVLEGHGCAAYHPELRAGWDSILRDALGCLEEAPAGRIGVTSNSSDTSQDAGLSGEGAPGLHWTCHSHTGW